jgi:hypothetical protein
MESEVISSSQSEVRKGILDFEDAIKSCVGSFLGDSPQCPLTHSFADGIYVREICIPKGIILTGKIHKHSHPNFLMKGKVKVFTEFGGFEILEAPLSMISKAGTKRVVETLEDTVWVTVHLNTNNKEDISKIEKFVIAKTYEDYEKFIKPSIMKRLFNKLNSLL